MCRLDKINAFFSDFSSAFCPLFFFGGSCVGLGDRPQERESERCSADRRLPLAASLALPCGALHPPTLSRQFYTAVVPTVLWCGLSCDRREKGESDSSTPY